MRLVREVPRPDRHVSAGRVLLGVLAGVTVMGFCVAPEIVRGFGESKAQIAGRMAHTLANDAFSTWQIIHPTVACPATVQELAALVERDAQDPYGQTYEMYCDARGLVIFSCGEDAKRGTADDIWSVRSAWNP